MKIINFMQESAQRKELQPTCYMFKNKELWIDRSEIWGNPEEYPDSIPAYYRNFAKNQERIEENAKDSTGEHTAHVVYRYGQGGLGKSFVCQKIREQMENFGQEKPYVIMLDLQCQKAFEDQLKCLADEIMAQTGKKDLFPRFYFAYYQYKIKAGEEAQQEQRSTKWDDLHDKSAFNLASGAAGFLSSFGTISDVIDIANEGYKLLCEAKNNEKCKPIAHDIEAMDKKELRSQLVKYFAMDFQAFTIGESGKTTLKFKKDQKKRKNFVFLLDTLESMRYQVLRDGSEEDYLEWLAGDYGLFRFLPDSFWILFGREEIDWSKYDKDWEESFRSEEFSRPSTAAVREYLEKQLGGQREGETPDAEVTVLADEIIRQTDGYPLAVENYVDMYFRLWNTNLQRKAIKDKAKADAFRPDLKATRKLLLDKDGRKIISHRFMQYYTLQEREVLYTLVCLGTWTDEILEKLIWKGSVSNRLIYEEMCNTSFIHASSSGEKTLQGLMLETIMEECPVNLKKQILKGLLKQMENSDVTTDSGYRLLWQAVIHIAAYCNVEGKELESLEKVFLKIAVSLKEQTRLHDLQQVCEEVLQITGNCQGEKDRDLYHAAELCRYFVRVCHKEATAQDLDGLSVYDNFGYLSFQIWEKMLELTEEIGAYEQVYEVTNFLMDKFSYLRDQDITKYYLLRKKRLDFMQQLWQRFGQIQIEKEMQAICEIHEFVFDNGAETGKWNARVRAEYYFFAAHASEIDRGEEYAAKIGKCMEEYRSFCYPGEAEKDIVLYRMKIMSLQVQKEIDLEEVTNTALQGLRVLYRLYNDDIWNQAETLKLAQNVILLGNVETLSEEDMRLLQRMFETYYIRFYKKCDWKAYEVVWHLCIAFGLSAFVARRKETGDTFEVSDILRRGILVQNNIGAKDAASRMVLLVCYSLLGYQSGKFPDEEDRSVKEQLYRKCVNNLMLMTLLKKEAAYIAENAEADTGRLKTFLQFILNRGFQGFSVSECNEKKRELLGLLNWCGVDTDRALLRANYAGDAGGMEFHILEALGGWEWEMDSCADARMANTVLYTVWSLRDRNGELEETVLKILKDRFRSDYDARAGFWLMLVKDAGTFGTEWENHAKELLQSELDRLYDHIEVLTDTNREQLAEYDSRFQKRLAKGGSEQEKSFEEKLQEMIEAGDYDTARITIIKVFEETPKGYWSQENTVCLFYRDIIRNRSKENFVEDLGHTCDERNMKDKHYQLLRAYAYLNDRNGFVTYYWENRENIWEGLANPHSLWCNAEELYHMFSFVENIGEDTLCRDFLQGICKLCTESSIFSEKSYATGVLYHLKLITKWLPFEEVWNRDLGVKSIKAFNCSRIYENLNGLLPKEELLELFTEQLSICSKQEIRLSFFEGEFYAWLKDTFKDALERRLMEICPESYEAEGVYEGTYKEIYHNQLRSIVK